MSKYITGKRLTAAQVRAMKRALKRRGVKPPKVGRCQLLGGKGEIAAAVVCHWYEAGRHIWERK